MKKVIVLLVTGLLLGLSHQASAEQLDAIIACDNEYKLYVNGTQIGQGAEWTQAQVYSVSLAPGENLIAVEGIDQGGTAGLLADFKVDGTSIVTDSTWRCSTHQQSGWNNIGFDDSSWSFAREYYSFGEGPWGTCVGNMPTDTQAKWIWSGNADYDNRVYFRKSVTVGVINQLPQATIDSINPNPAGVGEMVYFNGHGNDSDGTVSGYNWRSSIDGQLSTAKSFSRDSLSIGSHTIYFKAKDGKNAWSAEVTKGLTITSSQAPTAEIPQLIRFQARLLDTADVPLEGLFNFTFRLYDTDTGGTRLWEETQQVDVEEGLLEVKLGSVTTLDLPFDKQYWLGIEVESDGEMSPRFEWTTVPYSFRSEK